MTLSFYCKIEKKIEKRSTVFFLKVGLSPGNFYMHAHHQGAAVLGDKCHVAGVSSVGKYYSAGCGFGLNGIKNVPLVAYVAFKPSV